MTMQIGDILHNARVQKPGASHGKLGLVELSERCGISTAQISRLEKNKSRPTVLSLVRISNALGLTLQRIAEDLALEYARKGRWIARRDYRVPFDLELPAFTKLIQRENKKQLFTQLTNGWEETRPLKLRYEESHGVVSDPRLHDVYLSAAEVFPEEVIDLIKSEFVVGSLMILEDLSNYLSVVRRQQRISHWDLGKLIGIDFRAIQKLERAEIQSLDWDLLLKLDQALECNGAIIGLAWAAAEFESGIFLKQFSEKDLSIMWSEQNKLILTNFTILRRLKQLSTRPYFAFDQRVYPQPTESLKN